MEKASNKLKSKKGVDDVNLWIDLTDFSGRKK